MNPNAVGPPASDVHEKGLSSGSRWRNPAFFRGETLRNDPADPQTVGSHVTNATTVPEGAP